MNIRIFFLGPTLLLLSGCAAHQTSATGRGDSQLSLGSSTTATINSKSYQTFSFNSGNTPPKQLEISSYLPAGGFGSGLTGYAIAYPSIIIKDTAGKGVSARLVSQKAVAPGWVAALHLESKWQIQLLPGKHYLLMVKASKPQKLAGTQYDTVYSAGYAPMTREVYAKLNSASSGSIGITLR